MSSLMSSVVELRPDLAAFKREATRGVEQVSRQAGDRMEKELGESGRKAGRKAGDAAGDGLTKGTTEGARKAGRRIDDEIVPAAKKTGDRAGKELGDGISKHAGGGISGLAGKLDSVGKKMMLTGGVMTAGLTVPMTLFAKGSVDAAAQLEDARAANEQLFGDSYNLVKNWASKSADVWHMAEGDAQSYFTALGGQLQTLGKDAAPEAIKMLERVADVRSIYGGTIEGRVEALVSGYAGEFESIKRNFNIQMSQADVVRKAGQMGLLPVDQTKLDAAAIKVEKAQQRIDKLRKEGKVSTLEYADAQNALAKAQEDFGKATEGSAEAMSAEARILATNALVLERTAVAEGDLARTRTSAANQLQRTQAAWTEMRAELGTRLLPIITRLAPKITDMLKRLSDKGVFDRLVPAVEALATALAKALETFTKLPSSVQAAVIGFAAFGGPIMSVVGGLTSIVGAAARAISALRGVQAASAAANAVGGVGAAGRAGMLARGGQYGLAALAAGGIAVGAVRGMNWLDNKTGGHFKMQEVVDFWHGKIPGMAEGGYVTQPGLSMVGERGPELLSLPAGAQVTPLDRAPQMAGATSTTVNMSVTVNGAAMSADDLARALERLSRDAAASTVRTRRYR